MTPQGLPLFGAMLRELAVVLCAAPLFPIQSAYTWTKVTRSKSALLSTTFSMHIASPRLV
jgi:hypothetical protein